MGADAAWCGLCFASLTPKGPKADPADPDPAPKIDTLTALTEANAAETTRVAVGEAPAPGGWVAGPDPTWPCPACGTMTPIALDMCAACGTPFGRLFEEPDRAPKIAPRTAALQSVAFPGLGEWKCGRQVDGFCRMVAFFVPLATLLILVLSRLGRGGLGSTATLFAMFLLWIVFVWVTSATDAYRIASGWSPLIAPKWLLWGLIGLLGIGVGIASAVALPAIHRR